MKKGGKVYTPDERQPDFSKAKMISAGSFRKKRFEKNNIVQDAYVKHGIVKLFEWENKYSYTEYQSISGYYFDDKLKYAHIVYPDNYQMGTKWFTGIVTAKGKPVMGIRQTTKGLVENYRPYEQLAGDFANKLYDTTLLLSLVKKDVKNTTLSFSIPDDAEIFFSDQNNTRLKKYTTDSGFIIQPDSKIAEPNYTGPGIFYTNSGKLYAGQFSNGNPQGEGWLFVEGDSEDPTLSYKEHNMYGLFVAGKIQNGWYVAADHIYFSSPNRIISKTDLAAEWAALQKD
ncbi:MAG: hypothetical protein IPH18_08240 [Chitinophagaceae bacterium]|nr:hypothetical protein [Chitinophagaceae bacterium]